MFPGLYRERDVRLGLSVILSVGEGFLFLILCGRF